MFMPNLSYLADRDWIPVQKDLPKKNGEYIVCVKDFTTGDVYVHGLQFALSLLKTNTGFSELPNPEHYDRPGFYYTFGYGDAEEVEIDSPYPVDPLRVMCWMPFPKAPEYLMK